MTRPPSILDKFDIMKLNKEISALYDLLKTDRRGLQRDAAMKYHGCLIDLVDLVDLGERPNFPMMIVSRGDEICHLEDY